MTLVTMSSKDSGRLGVIQDGDADRLTTVAAVAVLGLDPGQCSVKRKDFVNLSGAARTRSRRSPNNSTRSPKLTTA